MNTAISFIIVLGLLIFVHELGHFIFAKLFGVRVLKFSLGFGPKLVGRIVGETEYVISAFPLGGFVKMYGENPDEQAEAGAQERARSFAHQPVWRRFCIVLAGPLFNILFTVVIFFFIFTTVGVPTAIDSTRIGQVKEQSPAATAGLMPGDEILQIDGVATVTWLDILEAVKTSDGRPLQVKVMRDGERLEFTLQPAIDAVQNIFGEEVEERYMIGIVKADEVTYEAAGIVEAFRDACKQTWMYITLTVLSFIKIIQQVVPASEIGGPILIAKIAGEQMQAGWLNLFYFMGLLSVNLGILNLLPIPVLDGGHLVFLTIEGLRRKPLDERAQLVAQQIGIGLLGTLMIFVFYNDIVRLFS